MMLLYPYLLLVGNPPSNYSKILSSMGYTLHDLEHKLNQAALQFQEIIFHGKLMVC